MIPPARLISLDGKIKVGGLGRTLPAVSFEFSVQTGK